MRNYCNFTRDTLRDFIASPCSAIGFRSEARLLMENFRFAFKLRDFNSHNWQEVAGEFHDRMLSGQSEVLKYFPYNKFPLLTQNESNDDHRLNFEMFQHESPAART